MSIFSLLFRWICFYTNTRHRLYITETLQKLYAWRKPIRPYAFIRVHNEIRTIDACLKSILPVVEGGVIGFNSCTDGTKEYILAFCEKYQQFTPVEYPYDVIPGNDIRYKEEHLDLNTRLDSYYNFVWSKLPKNKWIIKVDGDHIWHPKKTIELCKLPIRKKDCVILNRINLHCHDGKCYIHKTRPFAEGGDSWIIYNRNIHFEFWRGWIDDQFSAYEVLHLPKKERKRILAPLTNWHFPHIKNQRSLFNPTEWILIQDFDFQKYFREHNMQGRVADEMLDEEFILRSFNNFNLHGNQILP